MLSRTADHLYWMSRYMERAENIARFLDVANRLSLSSGHDAECWRTVLTIAGGEAGYAERHGRLAPVSVINYAVLDPTNNSSMLGCLRGARENAHAVRSTIPSELWEAINSTWLEAKTINGARLREQGLVAFCDWVKERSHLFRGAAWGIMVRDEAFHFARLGTFMERGDNTARLLGVRAEGVTAASRVADPADQLHWAAVLRSVSAYKAYRSLLRDDISPAGVAEMLIMRREMPRSLHSCTEQVAEILNTICHACECSRMAGAMHAELRFGKLDQLLENGLTAFVDQFIARTNQVGAQVHADFLMAA